MPSILVIDDDEMMREMLLQMLSLEGLDAFGVEDGYKAIAALKEKRFDLIITDIVMPDKDGLEIIQLLKSTQPYVPIIAISAGARIGPEVYLELAQEFGVRYTFAKPFEKNGFLTAVRNCLKTD